MKTVLRHSSEGSFVRDALRDLVVVVVGILAALWLESWWQDRQDQRAESQILNSLRAEFVENRTQLERQVQSWLDGGERFTAAHKLAGGPINSETRREFTDYLSTRMAGGLWFDPRFGQLASVINSGQLGLIRNTELRALVAGWPDLIRDMEFERQMFSGAMISGYGATMRQYGTMWPESAFEADVDTLMSSRQFDNEINVMVILFNILSEEGQVILELTDRIIQLIDEELGTEQ